ncbi:MAG TPA: flagellar motor protein MotB [Planctomycetota bacterium]|nr:flagellar motor protein MotB [Planctomycetota bacterium]
MAKLRKIIIGAPRPGEKDESEVRWLISYSDFMMQLVCLFILLYSVSSLDKGRMALVAAAYRASVGIGEVAAYEARSSGDRLAVGDRSLIAGPLGGGDLPSGLKYDIESAPGGIRIVLEAALFQAGSSELDDQAAAAVDAVARVLRGYAGPAEVTGSGDAGADAGALSLAITRAKAVVRRLERAGLDPRFLTAAGTSGARRLGTVITLRTD